MSLKTCIDNAVSGGELTLEEGQQLKRRYDTIARKVFARGEAKELLLKEIEAEAAQRKRVALLTEQARARLEAALFSHVNAAGFSDPMEAQAWLIDHEGQAQFESVWQRMQSLRGMVHGKMQKGLHEFRGKAKITGDMARRFGSTRQTLDDTVRELFGENTDNALAKEIAKEFAETAEELRQMYNGAGGAIGKLDTWRLPQHWNREALGKVNRWQFVEDVIDELDHDQMRHPLTGNPMSRDEIAESLEYIWENIASDGWLKREPSGQAYGAGALFKRHQDHRFLHFKDADSWMRVQKKYGEPDPWAAMMGHVSSMTRDIAMMQILGPNPHAMMTYLTQKVAQHANTIKPNNRVRDEQQAELLRLTASQTADAVSLRKRQGEILNELDKQRRRVSRRALSDPTANGRKVNSVRKNMEALHAELHTTTQRLVEIERGERFWSDADDAKVTELLERMREERPDDFARPDQRAQEWAKTAERMFDSMRGLHGMPEPGNLSTSMANFMQGVRNLQVATKLGGAGISALTDTGLQRAARLMAGMPVTGMTAAYLKQFGPGMQQRAMQQSLILDAGLHYMDQQTRYGMATSFSGWTGYAADRVLVAGGLSQMTQVGKHTIGLEMQAFFGTLIDQDWEALPAPARNAMQHSGITPMDWDAIRSVGTNEHGFLDPAAVYQRDETAAHRYLGHIHRIMRAAVAEPTSRQRVALLGDSKSGTIYGEFLRSFYQFKGFGVSVLFLHGTGMYRDLARGDFDSFAGRAISTFIVMSLMGAVALQLKDLVSGRDPRDMTTPAFWGAAMLQGGGAGIWGDFLFADHNRFGGSALGTTGGPTGGMIEDILKLSVGNATQLIKGEDTDIKSEAVKFAGRNVPGQNIFYLRLAWERLLLDRLQQMADPNAHRTFRRRIRSRQKDYGQSYWWAPGQDLDDARAPAASAVFGD